VQGGTGPTELPAANRSPSGSMYPRPYWLSVRGATIPTAAVFEVFSYATGYGPDAYAPQQSIARLPVLAHIEELPSPVISTMPVSGAPPAATRTLVGPTLPALLIAPACPPLLSPQHTTPVSCMMAQNVSERPAPKRVSTARGGPTAPAGTTTAGRRTQARSKGSPPFHLG
jgi:hypothetical protein